MSTYRDLIIVGSALFILLCLIMNLYGASAETYSVSNEFDTDFNSIQDAINQSQDGDVIRIFDGTYSENIVVNKSVTLHGNSSKSVIIENGNHTPFVTSNDFQYFDTNGSAKSVIIRNNTAFIADGSNGIIIIDVSQFKSPKNLAASDPGGHASDLTLAGDMLFVAIGSKGMAIYDVSNLSDPILLATNDTQQYAYDIAVHGNFAFVADQTNGVVIFNISDVNNPRYVTHFDTNGSALGVEYQDEYVFVADQDNGIVILDVKNISNIKEISTIDTNGSATKVIIRDKYAYISDYLNGVTIIDISDRENPIIISDIDTSGRAQDVFLHGNHLFIADDQEGTIILDISNPFQPEIIGSIDSTKAYGIHVSENYAYIADGSDGLLIAELMDNTDAIQIYNSNVTISGITVNGSHHAGISIFKDDVNITNCALTNNKYGIQCFGSIERISVHGSKFENNTAFGVYVQSNVDNDVNATNNWWGNESGPYHPTLNPDGKGDEVSDYVDYEPWRTRPENYQEHYVSPEGNDTTGTGDQSNPYRSIQKAIDMAQDWDKIIVGPGTYDESITIDKRELTVVGESWGTTILGSEGAATTCIITADNVKLNGFTIRNGNENGILIINSSGNRIMNCDFPDNSYDLNFTNSIENQLVNTTFESVFFSNDLSYITVYWCADMKVSDNRSGFIPDAHVKITDKFGTTVFNEYSDDSGRIPQLVLVDYEQNRTGKVDYNPYTISIWKDGYLNYEGFLTVDSYTRTTLQIEEHLLPEAVIIGEMIQYVDMDSPIFFDGTESTGRSITYFWEIGDGNTSTFPSPSHTFTVPGSYQVNLTVTDDYQNISTATIVVIVENVIPTARADSDIPSANEDDVIAFTAQDSWDTISDSLSFLWDFGDGTLSSEMTPYHAYSEQGQYDVNLRVMDQYGGISSTVLTVTVSNVDPKIQFVDISGINLPGKQLRFSVTAEDTAGDQPNLFYLWDFGDSSTASGNDVNHSYQKAGTYSVEVTVMDDDGASHSRLLQYNIKEPMIPAVASSHMVFQDENVSFNVSHELDDGSYSYTWYFGDGSVATGKDTVHKFTAVGVFTPIVVINDGRENLTIMLQDVVVNNVIPEPHINITITQVTEDEVIIFDASDSTDSPSDLSKLTFTWDFGDGSTGIGMVVNHAYTDMETYSVVLTIWDGKDTNTTQVVIEVENQIPIPNAGLPKEREGIVGIPVILDASASADTPSDLSGLNYTWSIENDTVYGKTCSYVFASSGTYSVVLTVTDDDGATSSDTITFLVSDAEESEDEGMINGLNLILIVIMIVLIVVIGYLVSRIREDQMIHNYITKKEEEAIEVATEEDHIIEEGKLDNEMFKPPENSEPAGNGSEETVGTESSSVKEKVDETAEEEKIESDEQVE